MRSGTCERHADAVVVMFDNIPLRGGSPPCPLCGAEEKIADQEKRIQELESELEAARLGDNL